MNLMVQFSKSGLLNSFISAGRVGNEDSYKRFERLSETFTWSAVILGVLIIQLPFGDNLNKTAIYFLAGGVVLFAFIWYHLLPKKFSGVTKRFIYSLITIVFIAAIVHYTNGVRGYTIFFYFLSSLSVAMTMPLANTVFVILFVGGLIYLEAFLMQGEVAVNFSLATLHFWALILIAFYARLESGEATLAKKREEQITLDKEKMVGKLKDEFVFIISHELKQPATAIKGYIEEIFSKYSNTLGSEAKEVLEFTDINSTRLSKLLEDLLDVSRIEKGSLKVNSQDVFLKEVISEVLSNLFFDARNKKISLIQRGDADTAVRADPDRLKEVLTNLVGNGVKYTPEGGQIVIEVKNEGEFASVSVSDNGIGISPEDQKHLFEKFYRVENEQTKSVKGSGLGLFITRNLVEKMGGEIGVNSKVGVGTMFYFKLPRYRW